MGHVVKCAICGESFDRDKIQAVIHGSRRYSHYECEPDKELVPLPEKKEDPELKALKDYINNLMGKKCNWAMIMKQIREFKEEKKYTYSGMLKSLIYFYEIKNGSINKSLGAIGIIPFVYNDAYNYYYNLYIAKQNINENNITKENSIKEITIDLPISKPKEKKKFNFMDMED
jgi:hypothetical protein